MHILWNLAGGECKLVEPLQIETGVSIDVGIVRRATDRATPSCQFCLGAAFGRLLWVANRSGELGKHALVVDSHVNGIRPYARHNRIAIYLIAHDG